MQTSDPRSFFWMFLLLLKELIFIYFIFIKYDAYIHTALYYGTIWMNLF